MSMQGSSVLIVHPSAERFPMASGKFGRHYSLDSPGSLTSPPGYDLPMMDHKPPTLAAATLGLSMPSSTCPSITSSAPHCFSQFNPHHLVYGTGPTGLPLISKQRAVPNTYTCMRAPLLLACRDLRLPSIFAACSAL